MFCPHQFVCIPIGLAISLCSSSNTKSYFSNIHSRITLWAPQKFFCFVNNFIEGNLKDSFYLLKFLACNAGAWPLSHGWKCDTFIHSHTDNNFILAMISVHYAHPMCPFCFLLPWNVHCVIHLDQSFHNK